MLGASQRRARPMDLAGPSTLTRRFPLVPEATWVEPMPDARMLGGRRSGGIGGHRFVRLAFIAAPHLPPRQRAVLILREVLRWRANEVAELLDTTVASVNSALQRARATLASSTSMRVSRSRRSTTNIGVAAAVSRCVREL